MFDKLTRELQNGNVKINKEVDTSRKDKPLKMLGIGVLRGNPFSKDIELVKQFTKKQEESGE